MLSDTISEEKALVGSLKGGDKNAFTIIFEKYHKQLYYIALSYLKDPSMAQDVVQDMFIKLWAYRVNLKEELSLKSFLITSLRNLLLNNIRNNNTRILKHIQLMQWSEVSRNDVDDKIAFGDYEKIIEKGMCKLSPAKQHIFRLRTQEGLNNKEISKQLGLSINTVKFQFSKASRFMRDYLKENAGI